MEFEAVPGAVCAAHPSQPIAFACARCGAFACEACRSGTSRDLCPACDARTRQLDLQVLRGVRTGFAVAARAALPILPVLLAQAALRSGATLLRFWADGASSGLVASLPPRASSIAISLLLGILFVPVDSAISGLVDGYKIVAFDEILSGRRPHVLALSRRALRPYFTLTLVLIGASMALTLGSFLCCVPEILIGAVISFAEQEVVLGGSGVVDAFSRSYALAKPAFWRLVAVNAAHVALMFALAVGSRLAIHFFWRDPDAVQRLGPLIVTNAMVLIGLAMDAIMTALYRQLRPGQLAAWRS